MGFEDPRKAERERQAEELRLRPHELEVMPWLRQLGFREDESRIAARCCREMAEAPLEERVKRALRWFGARLARTVKPASAVVEASVQSGAPAPC